MGIFAFIYLVFLICLIVGLIKPQSFSKLFGLTVTRKKIGLVFGAPALIAFILFEATTPVAHPPEQKNTQSVVADVKIPVKTEPPTTTPAVVQKELTTIDKLWMALDSSIGSRKLYDIGYVESTKTVKLTLTDLAAWDENSIVKDAYAALVKYGSEAFKIDAVDLVTIDVKTEMQNQYGKSSLQDVIVITMPRDEFEKYDWNALKYKPISQQIKRSSTKYYIHPAILSKLDPDKLLLTEPIK